LYDGHLYPGGACRLHTLRCELGDGTFWSGVRDYLATYSGKVVETDDFRRKLEDHSGRSLGKFFDQWFHSKGYPIIKVGFEFDSKKKEGTFNIEQTQVDEKEGIPAFELRTDVGWVIDGQSHTAPVKMDGPKQSVIVPMDADPEQVRFDPGARVLHKLEMKPGDKKLRGQLTSAPDVIGRIIAGAELADSGRMKNIEAVRDAYREEPFWGVRVEWAKALGGCASEHALRALVELLEWEQDPMVLSALVRAAGKYRDPRIRAAIESRLEDGLPYWATAVAYGALGAQRKDAPFEALAEAAATPGFAGITQSAALRALAATRRDEAIEVLTEAAAFGATPNSARPAAVTGLAEMGRLREKGTRSGIVEALVDLLRDPTRRVRAAAVTGLESMAAGEAIPALTAFRAPLSVQEQVRVDRALAAIRKGQASAVQSVEKQLEEVQTKLRKLGERLDKLEGRAEADDDQSAAASDAST
jgi:aminopeptidase N